MLETKDTTISHLSMTKAWSKRTTYDFKKNMSTGFFGQQIQQKSRLTKYFYFSGLLSFGRLKHTAVCALCVDQLQQSGSTVVLTLL